MKTLLTGILAAALPLLATAATAAESKVLAYRVSEITLYKLEGTIFRKDARVPAAQMPAPPVPIAEVSPKGYIRVTTSHGPVWLDEMDVRVDLAKGVSSSGCDTRPIAAPSDRQLFAGAGAGEKGCPK